MSEPFVGQITAMAFGYAPKGWAQCNGQVLPITQNAALYSLLGTNYGGNGQTTFALPDLRSRTPIAWSGQIKIGQAAGSETVTLTTSQMPQHIHMMIGYDGSGDVFSPAAGYLASPNSGASVFTDQGATDTLSPLSIATAGGSQPHNNLQPYLALNFCIALQGIFPSRN